MSGRCVIVCVLFRQAPFAGQRQIIVVIRSAAFERVNMLDNPKISRAKFATALVATAVLCRKDPRSALRRH